MIRRLSALVIAALLLSVVPAAAAITVTSRCFISSITSGNTVACSLTGSTAAGSALVILIERDSATETISSVSDGTNTYNPTPGSPCTQASGRREWTYYAKNASALTNPTWTVTFGTTATTYRYLVVAEVTGVSATAPFDKETCNSATASSVPDPGSVALGFNNEAILEQSGVNSADSVGSTFTSLTGGAGMDGNEMQYKVVTTGAWGVSAFATANTSWIAKSATFTDAVGGGCTPTLGTLGVGKCH